MTRPIRCGVLWLLASIILAAPAVAAETPSAAPAAAPAAPDAAAEKAAAEKAAKSAEAAKAVESLYGADLKRVKSTPTTADDIQLAQQFFAAAAQQAAQPEFAALLYEKAADLGLAGPEGFAVAAQALEQLAVAQPDRAGECAERLVVVRQRQFDGAKSADRPAAGETLLSAILALVEAGGKTDADATVLLKRAYVTARQIKSPRCDEIDARLAAFVQAMKTGREIEDIKALLARSPADAKLREKLLRLHLVDLDDPAAAAKLLDGVADESLKKYVPAAAKPLDEAPELACLELGEWYRTLAETAPPAAKPAMAARAKAYYERFLSLHAAEDLDKSKATAALQKLTVLIGAATAPAPKSAPAPAKAVAKAGTAKPTPVAAAKGLSAFAGTWIKQDTKALFTLRPDGSLDVPNPQTPAFRSGTWKVMGDTLRMTFIDGAVRDLTIKDENILAGWNTTFVRQAGR